MECSNFLFCCFCGGMLDEGVCVLICLWINVGFGILVFSFAYFDWWALIGFPGVYWWVGLLVWGGV